MTPRHKESRHGGAAHRYLGLDLPGPLVASASPLTGSLDGLRRLETAGAAAVVLPSLFEEQLTLEADQVGRLLEAGADSLSAARPWTTTTPARTATWPWSKRPAACDPGDRQPQRRHPRHLGQARQPAGGGRRRRPGAQHLLRLLQPKGGRPEIERRYLELIGSVRQTIGIPLAVKLSPYFSSVANLTRQLVQAGADGLVLFNRFYQPDLDLETLEVTLAWSCPPLTSCVAAALDRDPLPGGQPRWPPRPGCTPPPTWSRCSWPRPMWP